MERERALDSFCRDRGIYLPAPLSDGSAQDLYFMIGVFVVLLQLARMWARL